MSAFMPTYTSEDPNKDLDYSDCLKQLHSPQDIGSPSVSLGATAVQIFYHGVELGFCGGVRLTPVWRQQARPH